MYFAPAAIFVNQFKLTLRCIHHRWVSIFPVMTTLGSHDSKVVNTLGSLNSPVVDNRGETIMNMNCFSRMRKISKSFLCMSNRARRSCSMRKKQSKKLVTLSLSFATFRRNLNKSRGMWRPRTPWWTWWGTCFRPTSYRPPCSNTGHTSHTDYVRHFRIIGIREQNIQVDFTDVVQWQKIYDIL